MLNLDISALFPRSRPRAQFYPRCRAGRHRAARQEKLVVAIPKEDRLASRKTTTLAGLSDEVLVFYHRRARPGLTDAVIATCERCEARPR